MSLKPVCNLCNEIITDASKHVNAQVYGSDFHIRCLEKLDAIEIMYMLNLDDITINKDDKFIYWAKRARLVDVDFTGRVHPKSEQQ